MSNRTPGKAEALAAQGRNPSRPPADLAAHVDVVLTSLADDDAFEAVAARVVAAARPGTILVDMSTVSPAASARVASLAEAASVDYLRAPVSGNPTVVRAGNLSFIVSGRSRGARAGRARSSARSGRQCTTSATASRHGS